MVCITDLQGKWFFELKDHGCFPEPLFTHTHIHTHTHTHAAVNMFSLTYIHGPRCNSGKSVRLWCNGSLDRSFTVNPLRYFAFQPVLHEWCNKGHGMVHIKDPLLLMRKSSPCGSNGFPLSVWSFTIYIQPYNRK